MRHRETQTLFISDLLHVPFLKQPGYGKVQVGIYITALDDAFHRLALDKLAKRENVGSSGSSYNAGGADSGGKQDMGENKRGGAITVGNKRLRGSTGGHTRKGGGRKVPSDFDDSEPEDIETDADVSAFARRG